MKEIFATKIISNEHSLLGKFEIDLDETNKKHLIITGKNGSGKSTLLKELKAHLEARLVTIHADHVDMFKSLEDNYNRTLLNLTNLNTRQYNDENENQIKTITLQLNQNKNNLEPITKAEIVFNNLTNFRASYFDKTFITVFFKAHRKNLAKAPETITKTDFNEIGINLEAERFNNMFIQYLVNLRTEYLNEKDIWDTRKNEEAKKRADELSRWFKHLENTLKKIFNKDDLVLEYEHKKLNFYIQYDYKKFYLDELSDGYSALISILSELILRMELEGIRAKYDI